MGKILGKFQMSTPFNTWKGTTSDNHLGSVFKSQPQKMQQFMVELLAMRRGKSLDSMLSKFPVKTFESDDEYTWDVIGSSRRNIPLLEARDEDGNVITDASPNVGENSTPFFLVFGEDWFADGEVIFGNLNEVYQFRILEQPKFEGSNVVYTVNLMGNSPAGVPAERLLAGERFSVGFAPVEAEMSRKVGDIRFATPTAMRNEFSRVRIQHKVAGNKLGKKIAVGVPLIKEDNGKVIKQTTNMWMHWVEWELEKQFSDYKNMAMTFGRSNRNGNGEYLDFGKSGNVIKMGDGLFAQLEVSNVTYYNKFSLKLIESALMELSTNKLDFGDRIFVIKTGQGGATLLHKEIMNTVSGWTAFATDGNPAVIQKTNSPLHSNALSAGFQFVEYKAPNGVVIKIDVDPMYDDTVQNKIMHPTESGVAMSYRFDIFYMGNESDANIFKCKIKGEDDMYGYEWGFRNPFTGQMDNMYMSHDEDSATFHRYSAFGVCVLDPTKSISFIPSILQG